MYTFLGKWSVCCREFPIVGDTFQLDYGMFFRKIREREGKREKMQGKYIAGLG